MRESDRNKEWANLRDAAPPSTRDATVLTRTHWQCSFASVFVYNDNVLILTRGLKDLKDWLVNTRYLREVCVAQ